MPERQIGRTPLRAVRVAASVWEPAKAKAAENGETLSDVIRRALVEYTTTPPTDRP